MELWVPFLSGLVGALFGALSSLGGTWLAGRQRREERQEEAKQRVADREAAEKQRVADREAEEKRRSDDRTIAHFDEAKERMRAEIVGATTGALSLAADLANRPAPRSMHITPAELRAYQTRAATVGNLLVAVAITNPVEDVVRTAQETTLKISGSLGTLVEGADGHRTNEEENEITKAAVDSASALLEAVRRWALPGIL